jgi:hypothetical protein
VVREGYCNRNPFDGLRVRQRHKVSEERSAFSSDDLKQLFSKATYATAYGRKPNQYWLPHLGLNTGARLNELCQLYADDVLTIDGISCIHIRATRLSGVSGEGRAAGEDRVFPELTCHKKHGYSSAPSK